MKPCGYAAHVDSVDELRSAPLPTIACTTLAGCAHIHKADDDFFQGGSTTAKTAKKVAGQEAYELN